MNSSPLPWGTPLPQYAPISRPGPPTAPPNPKPTLLDVFEPVFPSLTGQTTGDSWNEYMKNLPGASPSSSLFASPPYTPGSGTLGNPGGSVLRPVPQGEPGHSQPGYSQLGHNQPGHKQPGYRQPGYRQPGHNQASFQNSGDNQPSSQNLGNNQPSSQGFGYNKPGHNQPSPQSQSHTSSLSNTSSSTLKSRSMAVAPRQTHRSQHRQFNPDAMDIPPVGTPHGETPMLQPQPLDPDAEDIPPVRAPHDLKVIDSIPGGKNNLEKSTAPESEPAVDDCPSSNPRKLSYAKTLAAAQPPSTNPPPIGPPRTKPPSPLPFVAPVIATIKAYNYKPVYKRKRPGNKTKSDKPQDKDASSINPQDNDAQG